MKKTFVRDLAIGQAAETRLVEMLEGCGHSVELNTDKKTQKYYDVYSKHPDFPFAITFEVKNDVYANKSGNIAIEVYNPKTCKPSGLYITEALFWVHYTDRLYITTVDSLRDFVESTKPLRVITAGGDGNATLYLYKKEVICESVFHERDNFNEYIQDLFGGILFEDDV